MSFSSQLRLLGSVSASLIVLTNIAMTSCAKVKGYEPYCVDPLPMNLNDKITTALSTSLRSTIRIPTGENIVKDMSYRQWDYNAKSLNQFTGDQADPFVRIPLTDEQIAAQKKALQGLKQVQVEKSCDAELRGDPQRNVLLNFVSKTPSGEEEIISIVPQSAKDPAKAQFYVVTDESFEKIMSLFTSQVLESKSR